VCAVPESLGHLLAFLSVTPGENDLGAFGQEQLYRRLANPTGAAGNQSDFVSHPLCHATVFQC
jgi:hypothetical protein